MQKFKPLLIELIWLAIILNATVLITIFVFGWTFLSNHFDIRLHETYFTISSWKIVLPLYVFVVFVIYSIKEIKHSFTRKAPNITILITGGILVLLIATINKQVIITEILYFTDAARYPPLSAMNEAQKKSAISPAIHVVSNSLTVIQFLVTLAMLYVAFKMGRTKPVVSNIPMNGNVSIHKPRVQKPEVGSQKSEGKK
jgi:hypothetical protein